MFNTEALNATEVASILHIGRNAVYALAKTGELPSYKMGRKLLFSLKDVQSYLQDKRSISPSCSARDLPTQDSRAQSQNIDETFVIAGQGVATDLIVDRLQTLGKPAIRKSCGSYTGLIDIYKGRANAALLVILK